MKKSKIMKVLFAMLLFAFSCNEQMKIELQYSSATDHEGNKFKIVIIDNMEWSTENLQVTTYLNGDKINKSNTIEEFEKFGDLHEGCYFINEEKGEILYNWYTIIDNRGIAPEGWHVSTKGDWKKILAIFSDKGSTNADPFKSKTGWPDRGFANHNEKIEQKGTNESGLNIKQLSQTHGNDGVHSASFWTNTSEPNFFGEGSAWYIGIYYHNVDIDFFQHPKRWGRSIRIVKD